MKTCTKCGGTKPLAEYPMSKRTIDRHLWACTSCTLSYSRQWKLNNPEKKVLWYDNYLVKNGKTRRVLKTEEEKRIRDNATIAKWRKEDRKKHPEKYKTTQRKREWQRKNREYNPDQYKAYSVKARRDLVDSYILRQLFGTVNMEVPKALIEAKRLQILIRRSVNENRNSITR